MGGGSWKKVAVHVWTKCAAYFTIKLTHSSHRIQKSKMSMCTAAVATWKHLPHKHRCRWWQKTTPCEKTVQKGEEYSHISSVWAWIHRVEQNSSSGFCGGSHHPIFCRSHCNAWLSCRHTHRCDCWCSWSRMQLHSSTFYRLASRTRQDHPARRTSLRIEWLWFCPNISCMKTIWHGIIMPTK